MKTRNIIIAGIAVIGAGFALRSYMARAADSAAVQAAQSETQDQNPWLMHTQALDAYQFYASSTQETRFVYGVGNETTLVSTEMLNTALANQRAELLEEMQQLYQRDPYVNYESYFGYADTGNPYWAEINRAVQGDAAQLANE